MKKVLFLAAVLSFVNSSVGSAQESCPPVKPYEAGMYNGCQKQEVLALAIKAAKESKAFQAAAGAFLRVAPDSYESRILAVSDVMTERYGVLVTAVARHPFGGAEISAIVWIGYEMVEVNGSYTTHAKPVALKLINNLSSLGTDTGEYKPIEP